MRTGLYISLALIACTAERPGADKPDAAVEMTEELAPPTIDVATPTTTPNSTVAIRGTTNGTRIVVTGGPGDAVFQSALPTGGYCIDAPLEASGPTNLVAYALKDGLISTPTPLTVTKDAGAPIPQSAQCSGTEAPVCVAEDTAGGNCANDKDDNCNGYADECETGCNGCTEDALGPNWTPFFVPMIPDGVYQLSICPCRNDYFAFQVTTGQTIHVKATFDTTAVDVDMRLQTPKNAEDNLSTSVASSTTTTGIEEITWAATATGTYYLKVYSYRANGMGNYTLTVY